MGSSKLQEFRISQLIHYLLTLSYACEMAQQLSHSIDQKQLEEAEKNLSQNFFSLNQTEVAMVYSGLSMISQPEPHKLKRKIQETYGFRLWNDTSREVCNHHMKYKLKQETIYLKMRMLWCIMKDEYKFLYIPQFFLFSFPAQKTF